MDIGVTEKNEPNSPRESDLTPVEETLADQGTMFEREMDAGVRRVSTSPNGSTHQVPGESFPWGNLGGRRIVGKWGFGASSKVVDPGARTVIECLSAMKSHPLRHPGSAAGASRDHAMAITYYKRFRMEIDLDGESTPPALSQPFVWVPWDESLLDLHAEIKYLCFRGEIDAEVFPALGDRYGCQRLMREIRRKPGFLPEATWLIASSEGYVGTVQGVIDYGPIGAIQNVGVLPRYRGLGLGRALVRRALIGFIWAGVGRAFLEVTAENASAVQLYRRVGFRRTKTLYKAVSG